MGQNIFHPIEPPSLSSKCVGHRLVQANHISHCPHRILIAFFCPTFLIRGIRRIADCAITPCTRIKSESNQIYYDKQCLVQRACDFIHHHGQFFPLFVISGHLLLLSHSMKNPLALIFNLSRSFLKTTSSYPCSPNLHRLFYFPLVDMSNQ